MDRLLFRAILSAFSMASILLLPAGLSRGAVEMPQVSASAEPEAKLDVLKTDPGGHLALVKDGASVAPIVVFKKAPPYTRRAADELADYIEKMSGAKPKVIEGKPDPIPEHAIWVGYQPALTELFPDCNLEFKHPEEILIAANKQHLVIAGRDRWDPDGLVREMRNRTVNGVQFEYGTINAVYTFLQDFLGVRWLWPGEMGEDVLAQETIAFEPFTYRYHPQIRDRSHLFRLSHLGDGRTNYQWGEWQRFQRLQLDSLDMSGADIPWWGEWWDRFHKRHPEYFALQPDGTRGGGEKPYPNKHMIKMCASNPLLWEQWLAYVDAYVADNPRYLQRTGIEVSHGDSHHRGHCICKKCRSWDEREAPPVHLTWQGVGQKYVSLTDRYVRRANEMARLLKDRYPDKEYMVSMYAYGAGSLRAPVEAVPDDNVIIRVVANFHNRRHDPERREIFADWAEIGTPHLGWRPNLGYNAGWHSGMPNVAPHRAIKDMRYVAENGCIGLQFDTVWEHWANHGPHYYMLGRMAWNPYADGEAILQDYYQRAFGKAAAEMEAYWKLIDKTSDRILFDGVEEAKAWDEAFFERARGHLDRSRELLADEPEVYRRRVEFVGAGLEYTRLYYRNRELIRQMEESEGENPGRLKEARANWERIVQIFEDYPVAFNGTYVNPKKEKTQKANPDSDR